MSLDVYLVRTMPTVVYEANVTHNLGEMAAEAGIYVHLWRPEELNITVAEDLIAPLEKGLELLKEKPDYFRQFDAENGWGKYENLVAFVEQYLEACKDNMTAKIESSR